MIAKLFSIIIPTRNRQFYCLQLVESLVNMQSSDIEIIVQDNSEDDSLGIDILNLYSGKVKYFYDNSPYSFADNFNIAFEKASGDYICALGDDDGIVPEILNIVKWIKKKNIDAVIPLKHLHYIWPGVKADYGELTIMLPEESAKIVKTKDELNKFLRNGAQDYPIYGLPRIYHGIVKREVIKKIKLKYGFIFGGLSPDIFSVILLTSEIEQALLVNFPLTIAGACPGSGTAENKQGKHCGKLETAPHFRHNNKISWPNELPRFYSVETIWAESTIASLKIIDDKVSLSKLNYVALISQAFVKNPKIISLIIEETNNWLKLNCKNYFLVWTRVIIATISFTAIKICKKVLRIVCNRFSCSKTINMKNINSLQEVLTIWNASKSKFKTNCYKQFES